ncbi:dihydrofolate reductase family protein [Aliikangiella sp. IMCC44653]
MTNIKFCVFIACSLDGYIARQNGKLDWLEKAALQGDSEDYGYQNFLRSVECITMGRNTFEKVAAFSQWPYLKQRVIVVSRSMQKVPPAFEDKIELFGGKIEILAVDLQHQGVKQVYVDGGTLIQSMLKAHLINELTITQVPVLLGKGIPLFGLLNQDQPLKLVHSKTFPSGFVQSHYLVD